MTWKVPNPQAFGRSLLVAFGDLARYLDSPIGKRMPTFDTEAERDRRFPSPERGDQAMVGTTYWLHDGTTWLAWDLEPVAYTPTLTGFTIGSGTSVATYQREGRFNNLRWDFIMGAGSAVAGGNQVSLPSGMDAEFPSSGTFPANRTDLGFASYVDSAPSPAGYRGWTRIETATTYRCLAFNASATYLLDSSMSSTVPFTWASGDVIFAGIRYRMA